MRKDAPVAKRGLGSRCQVSVGLAARDSRRLGGGQRRWLALGGEAGREGVACPGGGVRVAVGAGEPGTSSPQERRGGRRALAA